MFIYIYMDILCLRVVQFVIFFRATCIFLQLFTFWSKNRQIPTKNPIVLQKSAKTHKNLAIIRFFPKRQGFLQKNANHFNFKFVVSWVVYNPCSFPTTYEEILYAVCTYWYQHFSVKLVVFCQNFSENYY